MKPTYPNDKALSKFFKIDGSFKYIFLKNMKIFKKSSLFRSLIKKFIFILNHKYAESPYQKYYFLK